MCIVCFVSVFDFAFWRQPTTRPGYRFFPSVFCFLFVVVVVVVVVVCFCVYVVLLFYVFLMCFLCFVAFVFLCCALFHTAWGIFKWS